MYDYKTGYSRSDELDYTPMPQVAEVINCKRLNVRKSPSLESKILCEISKGDRVNVEDVAGKEFYKVTTTDLKVRHGYCLKEYLKIVE